jgi:HEAT repeat protein
MGKVTIPVVLEVLWEAVRNRVTEPVLGIKSPPRCFVAALALAELQTAGAAEAIGALLTPKAPPPDLVLLLRALARTGDEKAVEIIRRFLRESETEQFPIALWGADPAHPTSFRDAVVVRAVRSLAELGSSQERARVETLCNHPHLLMRRHARRVLAEVARVGATGRGEG